MCRPGKSGIFDGFASGTYLLRQSSAQLRRANNVEHRSTCEQNTGLTNGSSRWDETILPMIPGISCLATLQWFSSPKFSASQAFFLIGCRFPDFFSKSKTI